MKNITRYWLSLIMTLSFVVVFLLPGEAQAQWNFETCNSTETTEVELMPAAAMLMLDRSGSMSFCWGYYFWFGRRYWGYWYVNICHSTPLWDVAVPAINNAVGALQSQMEFGIGFYPNPTEISLEAQIYAGGAISSLLNGTGPGGGTPTDSAIATIRNSETLNRSDQATAGVLITDGVPNSRQGAINEACATRDAGQTLYVVGLGGGTDTDFNNKLAAAAGTGCCGNGANDSCTNGVGVDPCQNSNVQAKTCYGSYQANNQTEFQSVLLGISNELSCTFPVDTSLYPEGDPPSDPLALDVRISGAMGTNVSMPHRDNSGNGEGWYYPSSNNQNQVALTETYCNQVAVGDVEIVETTLACPCQQNLGDNCPVTNPPVGVCPDGNWSCNQGYDYCEPMSLDRCPVPCPGVELGVRCHVDNDDAVEDSPRDWESEINRCKIGEVACIEDEPVCVPVFRPMPELCNGLDNNCDGRIDNLRQSWGQSEFSGLEISDDASYPGAACYEEDICRCNGNARGTHIGEGDTQSEEFDAYLEAWTPVCICSDR